MQSAREVTTDVAGLKEGQGLGKHLSCRELSRGGQKSGLTMTTQKW